MRSLKSLVIAIVLLAVVLGGVVFYVKTVAEARFAKKYEAAVGPVPIPFPLTRAEIDDIKRRAARAAASPAAADATGEGATEGASATGTPAVDAPAAAAGAGEKLDFGKIAYQRAVQRGKHYTQTRAACGECHGDDFGGKVLVESTLMGTWSAPNITRAGIVKAYKSEDWVRVIRHGLKPNQTPASMPSQLYAAFSDQEISDIAAYLRSVPPVERAVPPTKLGPLMWFQVARDKVRIAAEHIDHAAPRLKSPPSTLKASEELGKHLASVCSACHAADLAGGGIPGGDPDWPPARNLTPHASGLEKWSLQDFSKALREGLRPDGASIKPPMPVKYTKNLRDSEIEGLYMYLKTVPAKETQKD